MWRSEKLDFSRCGHKSQPIWDRHADHEEVSSSQSTDVSFHPTFRLAHDATSDEDQQ